MAAVHVQMTKSCFFFFFSGNDGDDRSFSGDAAATAVVTSRLKVHGLEGLRIADASVMPFVVTGNLNGPSMMIGQRASEIILEDSTN